MYSSEGGVDEDKIVIGCISDVHAQVILLGVIGIHAKNTFHFVGRIQLISNRLAILTNNEFYTFGKKSDSRKSCGSTSFNIILEVRIVCKSLLSR